MVLKATLLPSLLHLAAAILLLVLSCKILANHEDEKEGLVIISLSLRNTRRDIFGSVQSIATQATELGPTTLVPDIRSTAAGAASQVTAALSSVASEAASVETSILSQAFASNYTVGTKYACAVSSCTQILPLQVILCFGIVILGVSVITSALAFCLPFMKLSTLGASMLATLFFVVFAVCAVTIAGIGSLVDLSTLFHVQKGEVFAQALWVLGGVVVLAFSAVGIFFMPLR